MRGNPQRYKVPCLRQSAKRVPSSTSWSRNDYLWALQSLYQEESTGRFYCQPCHWKLFEIPAQGRPRQATLEVKEWPEILGSEDRGNHYAGFRAEGKLALPPKLPKWGILVRLGDSSLRDRWSFWRSPRRPPSTIPKRLRPVQDSCFCRGPEWGQWQSMDSCTRLSIPNKSNPVGDGFLSFRTLGACVSRPF